MITQEGFKVYLGSKIESNADRLRQLRNDKRIWDWCRQTTLLSKLDHESWIESLKGNPKNKMYTIHDSETTVVVGVCGLTNFDYIARHAEFSLYIDPNDHGKGYGKQALYLLVEHGFYAFNLNKIWGESFEGNPAIHMFEKLGFRITKGHFAHYYKNGKYLDSYFSTLLKDEWINCREQALKEVLGENK